MPDLTFRFNVTVVQLNDSFRMHSHEYAEMVVVLGGRAVHVTDHGWHPLENGDVAVIHPGTRHGYRAAENLKLCLVMYDPRQFDFHADLANAEGYRALFTPDTGSLDQAGANHRLHLPAEDLVYVTPLLSSLQSELQRRDEGWQTVIRSTFALLVTYLSRLYAKQKASTPLLRLSNVIEYIRQHFREPLAIEELARLAHLSVSQFQRSFKRIYNTTPVHFITQARLHEACELLKDPNQDITTVAFETGFSSSAFFATQFKRYLGESPSQYRRKQFTALDRPPAPRTRPSHIVIDAWRRPAPVPAQARQ